MKLTVLLPLYNEFNYVKDTLKSLQIQNYDFQVLVSDNASTDGTTDLVRSVIEGDERFHFFLQKKNLGGYLNFLSLIKNINTPFFMFLGGHDLISPGYFEAVVPALESDESVSMVLGEPHAINEDGKHLGVLSGALYDFNNQCRLTRYLQSVKRLANCTCVHSVYRSRDANGLKMRKTISGDHVFISHFLWKGNIRYVTEAKYFRRYFERGRMSTQSERIAGSSEYLSRHDFFNYYIESFRDLYGSSDNVLPYIEHKILAILEARWGSQALLPNDGLY
jgi:glycosyltransferase involved in cell wall biosynthesis